MTAEDVSADRLAGLRRAARAGTAAMKEADGLRRELALRRAGVPLDTNWGALFAKTWDGDEVTDSIRAAWGEIADDLAARAAPPPPELDEFGDPIAPRGADPVLPPPMPASTNERMALAAGGSRSGNLDPPDPRVVASNTFRRVVDEEGGEEGAGLAAMFDVLVHAAASGHQRARADGPRPRR